jgi:dsDNA-specific endonuclease/ATPase MutS2
VNDEPEEDDEPFFPEEVVVPLTDELDLHTFAPRDVRSVTEAYLEQAIEAGFKRVRVIHGRGIGVQRNIVRSLLENHPAVVSFSNAADRGGWGATVVELATPGSREEPPG